MNINPYNPHTTIGQLAAIWMNDSPVITGDLKRSARIEKGATVRLEDGRLVDCSADRPANFLVADCFGNIGNDTLMFLLQNMETKTPILYPVKTA